MPTGQDVAAFLGQGDDPQTVALADQALPLVTLMAKAYTRERGFDDTGQPNEAIAAVITVAAARLITNPGQLSYTVGAEDVRGAFNGWTLPELAVLNRYRKRAQ